MRLTAALLVLLTSCASASPFARELDAAIPKEFAGAVLVARNGSVVYRRGPAKTRFNIASMSKMFTAVAIAQLAERGRLSFGDKVSKYLPQFPNGDRITIHQLLSHTSGLGDFRTDDYFARVDELRTLESLLPLFAAQPLAFEPGTQWEYSNGAFIVAGLIVEKVSGQSYFDYVQRQIFDRAGMRDTEHRRGSSSAGGAWSTVDDLLRFTRALQNGRLVSEASLQTLTSAKAKVPPGWPMHEYGYGFQISNVNGVRIVGHGGSDPGVSAKLELIPERGTALIILSTSDLSAMMPIIMKTRELALR